MTLDVQREVHKPLVPANGVPELVIGLLHGATNDTKREVAEFKICNTNSCSLHAAVRGNKHHAC